LPLQLIILPVGPVIKLVIIDILVIIDSWVKRTTSDGSRQQQLASLDQISWVLPFLAKRRTVHGENT